MSTINWLYLATCASDMGTPAVYMTMIILAWVTYARSTDDPPALTNVSPRNAILGRFLDTN